MQLTNSTVNFQKKGRFENIKQDFPLFQSHPELIYLDSASTSQKPTYLLDAVRTFYEQYNANIHRGIYTLSQQATDLFEESRGKVARFIRASDPSEIIFTSNASEAINLVAYGWARKHLHRGDIIVTTEMEHHSNIVPWLRLKEEKGIELIFLQLTKEYRLNYQGLLTLSQNPKKIKLLTLTHASNVLGTVNPIAEIRDFLDVNAIDAKILIDAAQSIPHIPLSITDLKGDFLVFSSHKMLGPSGVGVLWAKKELLEAMDPLLVGSHMITKVTKEHATYAEIPDKFETGTRNLEGVIGLGKAIDYLEALGMENVYSYEQDILEYTLDRFKDIKGLKMYGPTIAERRLGVFSFTLGNVHAHDVAEILNRHHIAVRSGHHCAQVLMTSIGQLATVRASFYIYNCRKDVDSLVEGIESVKKIFAV